MKPTPSLKTHNHLKGLMPLRMIGSYNFSKVSKISIYIKDQAETPQEVGNNSVPKLPHPLKTQGGRCEV